MTVHETILKFLEKKKYNALFEYLAILNPVDIASAFEQLNGENAMRTFRLLPKDTAAEVFAYMESDVQERLIGIMSDIELERVTAEMFLDDTVDLISEMPAALVKRILKASRPEDRKIINELLRYPDDSTGSIMTTEFIDLQSSMSVYDALAKIRAEGFSKETIYTCYVLDSARNLIGIVTVKDLLLSSYDTLLEKIMQTNIITASTLEDKEEAVKKIKKYDLLALPVVDKDQRLVGIVTIDDAVEVYSEETEEDFELMAAIAPSDESYFKTSVFKHAGKRILWLFVLMFSSIATEIIIKNYENTLNSIIILASFIPMLMDTGGNCGAQSATVVIRGMATDEIPIKSFLNVLWKESRVALICSIILSIVNGIRIFIQYNNPLVAFTVSLTLICTIFAAKILGASLPMLAKRLKLDPAIMAAPLISTIVDACSVFIYFNLAVLILKI